MKIYKCDKCGDEFLTFKTLEHNCCQATDRIPEAENSLLDYPIRIFLDSCGDFCPECRAALYKKTHLTMKFLETEPKE